MKQSKKLCRLALLVVATMLLALAGCRNASGGGEALDKVTVLKSVSVEEAIAAIKKATAYETLKIELAECSSIEGLSQAVCESMAAGIELDLSKTQITSIGGFNSYFLTRVILPKTLTCIEDRAFQNTRLESIHIPASVTSIGEYAFRSISELSAINVAEGNTKYFSDNGVLYNSEKTKLIMCPPRKTGAVIIQNGVTSIGVQAFYESKSLTSVNIPSSVTSIGDLAFCGCESLTNVVIPTGVTSIGSSAFQGCTSLTNVSIPDSVTSIGNYAFSGCTSLTSINYTGTKDDWNSKITRFGSSWKEDVPAKIVTCQNGQLTTWVKIDTNKLRNYFLDISSAIEVLETLQEGETEALTLDKTTTSITNELKTALRNTKGKVQLDLSNTRISFISYTDINCKSLVTLTIPSSLLYMDVKSTDVLYGYMLGSGVGRRSLTVQALQTLP